MIVEDTSRPGWYSNKGVASAPAIGGYTPAMGSYQGGFTGPAPQGGGAWADPLNYNATNAAFGDGSVRFVINGLAMNQMQALLSRRQ
jgi:prepilin-type processing-associated H-X9-DG protein